jgi:hypothetical protein
MAKDALVEFCEVLSKEPSSLLHKLRFIVSNGGQRARREFWKVTLTKSGNQLMEKKDGLGRGLLSWAQTRTPKYEKKKKEEKKTCKIKKWHHTFVCTE